MAYFQLKVSWDWWMKLEIISLMKVRQKTDGDRALKSSEDAYQGVCDVWTRNLLTSEMVRTDGGGTF